MASVSSWILSLSSRSCWSVHSCASRRFLPARRTLVNEDRYARQLAACAPTPARPRPAGTAKTIRATAVWAGEGIEPSAACMPALARAIRRGLRMAGAWRSRRPKACGYFPQSSLEGSLRVEARAAAGGADELTYRAFSHPRWSPDGALAWPCWSPTAGRPGLKCSRPRPAELFYTSPPDNDRSAGAAAPAPRSSGTLEIRLPSHDDRRAQPATRTLIGCAGLLCSS